MLRTNRKPPLARSPVRLRSSRVLQSAANTMQSPPGSLTKSQKPKEAMDMGETDLRPEYLSISCELRALAKMVQQEFGNEDLVDVAFSGSAKRSPLFERGRFYEEYSARRNERLRRKRGGGETGEEKKQSYDLGVRVDSVKRRGEASKYGSVRKTVPSTPVLERREASTTTPRYLLRSITSKENKKPPLAFTPSTTGIGERKTAARRTRKI